MTVNDLTNCCKVTVEWSPANGTSEQVSVYPPSRLLWSAEGIAELFRISRSVLANPADHLGDDDTLECWNSFHIVSIKSMPGFVVDCDFDEYAQDVVAVDIAHGMVTS